MGRSARARAVAALSCEYEVFLRISPIHVTETPFKTRELCVT